VDFLSYSFVAFFKVVFILLQLCGIFLMQFFLAANCWQAIDIAIVNITFYFVVKFNPRLNYC